MTDRGRRLGKGIAIALAVHIVAAALLGILGYRFTQRPPQILEVTLGGGGGGGGIDFGPRVRKMRYKKGKGQKTKKECFGKGPTPCGGPPGA